jgi:predicted small secreted protein
MKKILGFFTTVALLVTMSGCNTVQGIGKDVQKAGEVVQDAAKKK